MFEALGVDKITESGREERLSWRKTTRAGHILFANVRSLNADALRCAEGFAFRLVIDYPFDEAGKSPSDDARTVERFMEAEGSWTLVWLPHFFSEAMNHLLGELVVLEHIFSHQDVRRQAVAHLSVENQSRALNDLENLRGQKRVRLLDVMEQAYGLKTAQDKDIDVTRRAEQHLIVLKPGAGPVRPELTANLASAKDAYIEALLEARYAPGRS